jgi:hypothetical protein
MITAPPSLPGGVKLTVAARLPATALAPVGTPGTPRGVTAADGALGALVPARLVAVTVKVYAVPLDNPVTVSGLPGPLTLAPPGLAVAV